MSFKAIQHPDEIAALCKLFKAQGIKSYLEIGAKFGGSLWQVARVIEPPGKITVVDLPAGTIAWNESEQSLKDCIHVLAKRGHQVRMIWGNSIDPKVIEQVRQWAPYDAVLIDANHTRPYVEQDWANYGPLGRIIAFHDIAHVNKPNKTPIDVPAFWNVIKQSYHNVEIRLDPSRRHNGFGVLWRE